MSELKTDFFGSTQEIRCYTDYPEIEYEDIFILIDNGGGHKLSFGPTRFGMQMFFTPDDLIPITTTLLKIATPTQKTVKTLKSPVFIIGTDDESLNWFYQSIEILANCGAQGFIVDSHCYERFVQTKLFGKDRGVKINARSGDYLAKEYDINSYPILLIGAN